MCDEEGHVKRSLSESHRVEACGVLRVVRSSAAERLWVICAEPDALESSIISMSMMAGERADEDDGEMGILRSGAARDILR